MIFQKPNQPGQVSKGAIAALLASVLAGIAPALPGMAGIVCGGVAAGLSAISSQLN